MTTTTPTPQAVVNAPIRGRRSPLASVALHVTLIVASVIAVFPVLWVLLTSLKPAKYAITTDFFKETTLENYTNLLNDTPFLTWFGNSLLVAALTTVIGVFISATTGYAVSRFRFPGKRGLMWTLLITQMFPVAVLIVPIYNIMASMGLLNQPAGLVITYLTIAVPFCAWMMKGFFDTIPREIDESGYVDGLTPFGTFWRLILPLAKPGIAVTAFYSFITAWGEVAYASAFMVGDENLTLAGGLQKFVNQYGAQWGPMAAASVLIAIPAALVFLFAQRHLVTGMSAGAVKG
ncbi:MULTISPECIES: carbohydrate ABC transporter permease [unclassified Streptomyces]|uniref:sugar ABC transporter permease n=1 Tax=Streptomyces sp. NPDC013489 TaxID=3155606 RepID=UPI000A9C9439|nr:MULTISPECIES: carbohydrate ABC transporter permease [unclassified Streptomyces]MCD2467229.1 carbohydrate ABC transporter permease [Streptomyces sp. MBT42]